MVDKKEMIVSLKMGIEKLREKEVSFEKSMEMMRNTDNWCFVHATRYLPRINPDGTMYIPTTSMATGFKDIRTTVHATLNHIVAAHGYGSWDNVPIVVLAPYKDVVADNGNPVEVSGTDTYWSLNPDVGLVLPKSAYVVKPDNNGPLFQIGENGATYKRENYTDKEIAQIESMLEPDKMAEYIRYKNGDLESWEIQQEIDRDVRVRKAYENAKDKKAFLCGLFEESRFDILAKYLRDVVVKMSMEQIGMVWVKGVSDVSELSYVISDTAEANGVPGNPSNKGHGNSVYGRIENCAEDIQRVLYAEFDGIPSIFNTDFESLYDVLVNFKNTHLGLVASAIISDLINEKSIDFLKIYKDFYAKIRETEMSGCENQLEADNAQLQRYYDNYFSYLDEESKNQQINRLKKIISDYRKRLAEFGAKKTIADYDKNVWESIRRHSERISLEYKAWRSELVKHPAYGKLVQKLRDMNSNTNKTIMPVRGM